MKLVAKIFDSSFFGVQYHGRIIIRELSLRFGITVGEIYWDVRFFNEIKSKLNYIKLDTLIIETYILTSCK